MAGSLLDIPHLARNVAGRTAGDRRAVAGPHQILAMTGDTGCRFARNKLVTDDFCASRRDQILSFGETPRRNVGHESDMRIAIGLRLLFILRNFDYPSSNGLAVSLFQ